MAIGRMTVWWSDPYSASKAAAELAIAIGGQVFAELRPTRQHFWDATARAGNVAGGGDGAEERIIPDAMRALSENKPIPVRSPGATRPWQHVLEPIGGYCFWQNGLFCWQ